MGESSSLHCFVSELKEIREQIKHDSVVVNVFAEFWSYISDKSRGQYKLQMVAGDSNLGPIVHRPSVYITRLRHNWLVLI